ncbi:MULTISPECIES: 3-deoxy-manno-octulosonate cytidylyltransferase [Thermodesulfobacterium]|jgi:3-deoxy-manno-octulosonate cytidylyltransferase (CMP-KDO synthetase)|uniref:3-deoxy-manno-octulosonate cytidylyltransferase n=1 Tax=Thermodesulfobacterium commune TaxID=1741 RepID=A0A101FK83_9BACT|nr:3-deoxy-manno-octulosonate cytidylyltransferase [Thermodesulfobacterium sp.]KUJ98212.1 MAG: 3-deoxy-manno-octulosonate cytidylyltransferase [Thermodesulfobacterium sp. 37_54]KUK19863.1 MAG: 3-deoxy-manno-octulosonate cytidylyltransferase [Thermodesulfobacterium commune]KUK38554.1 MAG: 3-deoxy-manno-octulosonate cytidylyltransferase [Thermodesulfobacterium commune]MBZ4681975.1 3-deoxy-manno-octulosonate cytidylyltransferase [Thermodesulfobacterium sp.]MDK2861113.1 3-deoxy-manno-octulosonate 
MRQVIIIPARYGSTRFPGKPLILINGKPMIQHVYERALSSKIKEIWVATDDERIFKEVLRFGGKALMTAKTHICGTDRVAEATELLGLSPEDIVVNLQGDQPFFPSEYFQLLIEPLLSGKAKMATLATPIKTEEDLYNPNKVKVVLDRKGYALYFSRSLIPYFRPPGEPPLYLKHIGVYAYTKEFLDLFVKLHPGSLELTEKLEQLRALEHGYKIAVNIVPEDVPEVDTPEDLEKLTKLTKLRGISL